jgi:hypothetical protein
MEYSIKHWPTCTADYPEKAAGEYPQEIQSIDVGDGETWFSCVDCGSSVFVNSAGIVTHRDNG